MRSASAAGCTHHPDQVLAAGIVKENIALPVAAEGTYPDDAPGCRRRRQGRAVDEIVALQVPGQAVSYGGFRSLEAARQRAREENLIEWDIFRGNVRVEHHDPR